MVFTRNQDIDLLKHILTNLVTAVEPGQLYHNVVLFLQSHGVTSYTQLMDLDDDDFSVTSFVPYPADWKEGDDVPAAILIKTAHLKRLCNIYRMLCFLRIEKDDELTFTEIVDIDSDRLLKHNIHTAPQVGSITPPRTPTGTSVVSSKNPVSEFKKEYQERKNPILKTIER